MQHVSHRTNVVRAYRQLLQLIKRLPPSQQGKALSQARSEAAADREIDKAIEASDKLMQLYARIGYLRTITPRRPGDAERLGSGRYVLRNGQLVPSDLRPDSRCVYHAGLFSCRVCWIAERLLSPWRCPQACGIEVAGD